MDLVIALWLVLCAPVTIALAVQAFHWPPDRRHRIALDVAASRHLVLDPVAGPLAERLLIAGRRGRFVGMIVVVALGVPVFALAPSSRPLTFIALAIATQVVVNGGAALGATLALRRVATAGPHAEERFAHLPTPTVTDYLPPLMRWWSVAVLGLATVGVAVCLTLGATLPGRGRAPLVVGWAVAAAAVATTEFVVRVLVRTPRTASTPAALAVSDEVTGDLAAVVVGAAMGPALLLVYAAEALVPSFAPIAPLSLALAGVPYILDSRRRRRVRERLWATDPAPGAAGAAAS